MHFSGRRQLSASYCGVGIGPIVVWEKDMVFKMQSGKKRNIVQAHMQKKKKKQQQQNKERKPPKCSLF